MDVRQLSLKIADSRQKWFQFQKEKNDLKPQEIIPPGPQDNLATEKSMLQTFFFLDVDDPEAVFLVMCNPSIHELWVT